MNLRLPSIVISLTVVSCAAGDEGQPEIIGFEPPVVINPVPPVEYPVDLFERGVEGTVVLRLFVDETGALVPDSTSVAEASGHPALDTAALSSVAELRFAPARRDGNPVASLFLQPVHFRQPSTAGPGPPQ